MIPRFLLSLWVLSVLSVPYSFAQDRLTFGLTTRAGSTSLPFVIGVASDQIVNNVLQLVRDTRKTKDDKTLADIVDWSFARKAQAELKAR
jgi:hypothetical protein